VKRILLFVVVLPFSGCYSHVSLSADRASATGRLASYEKLRPVRRAKKVHVTVSDSSVSIREYEELILANGVRVFHPEDLRPVVAKDSLTAKYIRDYLGMKDAAWWVFGVSSVTTGAGLAVGGVGAGQENSAPGEAWGGETMR
jgi:hypothetical protein